MALSADEQFLREALDLARKGIGLASPNPCVGAVIVAQRGQIIGRGTHTYDGIKHAEVLALEEARRHSLLESRTLFAHGTHRPVR
jgi:diaminohydroxyphosphoribosylaminopyrimidine deaminase/5-amino-6-(5-phosphoribosylamino)uracil reductase